MLRSLVAIVISGVAAHAQAVLTYGEAESVNPTTQTTLLAGPPEVTEVFEIRSSSLGYTETIYDRSGNTFFICTKARGIGVRSRVSFFIEIPPGGSMHASGFLRGSTLAQVSAASSGVFNPPIAVPYSFSQTNTASTIVVWHFECFAASTSPIFENIAVMNLTISASGSGTVPGQELRLEANGTVNGHQGVAPVLSAQGDLRGPTGRVELSLTAPNAPVVLAFGLPGPGVPALGGTIWPQSPIVLTATTTPALMGFGELSFPLTLPSSLVGTFLLQAFVADTQAASGYAFSNALEITLL